MITKKLQLACALAMMFGCLSIASAGYDTRACCSQDAYSKNAYSKFNSCCERCPIAPYPQQFFPLPSP